MNIEPDVREEHPCVCGAQVFHVCFRGVSYWRCENAATGCDAFGKTYEEALAYAHQQLRTTRLLREVTGTAEPVPQDDSKHIQPTAYEFGEVHTMMDVPLSDLASEDDQSLIKHLITLGARELDDAISDHEAYAALGRITKCAFLLGRSSARRLA